MQRAKRIDVYDPKCLEKILTEGRKIITQTASELLDEGLKDDYVALISYLFAYDMDLAFKLEGEKNVFPIEYWKKQNPVLAAKIASERKDFDAAIRIYEKNKRYDDALSTCMDAKSHHSKTNPEKAKYYEEKSHTYINKLMKEHKEDIGPIGPCF